MISRAAILRYKDRTARLGATAKVISTTSNNGVLMFCAYAVTWASETWEGGKALARQG